MFDVYSNLVPFAVVIRVDSLGRPERNREVTLFKLGPKLLGKDVDGNEANLSGFFPVVSWDGRWASKDETAVFYSCTVLSDRVLLIKMPAYDFGMLYGMKGFVMAPDSACVSGMNSGALSYHKDPKKLERQWAHFALEFSAGTKLSAKALDEDSTGVLDIQIFAIKCNGKTTFYCGWPVPDLAQKSEKLGDVVAPQKAKSKEAIAAEKMKALGIL